MEILLLRRRVLCADRKFRLVSHGMLVPGQAAGAAPHAVTLPVSPPSVSPISGHSFARITFSLASPSIIPVFRLDHQPYCLVRRDLHIALSTFSGIARARVRGFPQFTLARRVVDAWAARFGAAPFGRWPTICSSKTAMVLKIECPTGSSIISTLNDVAGNLCRRFVKRFVANALIVHLAAEGSMTGFRPTRAASRARFRPAPPEGDPHRKSRGWSCR